MTKNSRGEGARNFALLALLLSACSMPMPMPDAGRGRGYDGGITDRFPVLPNAKATKVVVGATFACALTTTQTVRCWGASGQTSDPTRPFGFLGSAVDFPRVPMPIDVPDLNGVIDIDASVSHVCVVLGNGSVSCWGANDWAKLGVELPEDGGVRIGDRFTPQTVNGVSGATKVVTGERHTCALLSSGGVKCWGGDFNSQLLNQSTENMRSGRPLDMPGITGATELAAYASQTCAAVPTGVKCWGQGPVNGSTEAMAPFTVPLTGVTGLAINRTANCAVAAGAAKCWGQTDQGLLGNGSDTGELEPRMPVQVSGATQGVTSITRQCAVISGAVKCWGRDGRYLGNGTDKGSALPVDVLAVSGATQVSSNIEVSCAVANGGQVWCWGDNLHGAVGNGIDVVESGLRYFSTPQRVLSFE